MRRRAKNSKDSQTGIALILALMIVFILSAAAASLIFATQTDVWTTANYNFLTQARYVAEAGAQATTNWIIGHSWPTTPAPWPCAAVTCTAYPMTSGGTPLVLTTDPNVTSNFSAIDGNAQSSFTAYVNGLPTLTSLGIPDGKFVVTAQLMSIPPTGWPTMTWKITSTGTIGSPTAWHPVSVQVVEMLAYEPPVPIFQYGAFATGTGCGVLSLGGSMSTDSYNSGWVPGGGYTPVAYNPASPGNNGNVGSNGNLNVTGSGLTVNGTYSSPNTGIGGCVAGSPDALTGNAARITNDPGGTPVLLAAPLVFPTPVIPAAGTASPSSGTIAPGAYGDISVGGHATLTLDPGTTAPGTYVYNINSLNMDGTSTFTLNVTPGQVIVINIACGGAAASYNSCSSPVNMVGNSTLGSAALTPEQLQINYAGTGTLTLTGDTTTTALVYAPNATVNISGHGDVIGAVVGKTVSDSGSASLHYDTAAGNVQIGAVQHYLLSFSWTKY